MRSIKIFTNKRGFNSKMALIGFILIGLVGFLSAMKLNEQIQKVKPLIVIKDANVPNLSYDGSRITVGPEIGIDEVYDVNSGKKLGTFREYDSEAAVLSIDGKRIRIFGHGIHSVYDVDSGKKISQGEVSIINDGKHIGDMMVLNHAGLATKNITSDLRFVADVVGPENHGNPDPTHPAVLLGNLEDNSLVGEFRTDDGFNFGDYWDQVAMTPNGKFVAATRRNRQNNKRDRTVIWHADSGKIALSLPYYTSWFAMSNDGSTIVARDSADDGKTTCWDILTGKLVSTLTENVKGRTIRITAGYISPDGKILTTSGMGDIIFWNTGTGKFLTAQRQDDISDSSVKAATFSGDGKRIAIATDTEIVTVWSVGEILKNGK